jgi:hypothetical protein
MPEPTPPQLDRIHRLEQVCRRTLDLCHAVDEDWTHVSAVQAQLPDIADTIHKAMLFVICIPTDDDEETSDE